jgi:microcin C transport system substrate-binding protein
MNRRSLLGSTLFAVAARPLTWSRSIGAALADDKSWRHGVSLFGDLKYPAGFRHFDYVNASPKGGTVREAAPGTFHNFNGVVASVRGSLAAGIDLIYETLLVSSLDEVATGYGFACRSSRYSS